MRPISEACPSYRANSLAAIDGLCPLGEDWSNKAKVAVNTDETIVLYQHLQTTDAFMLDPYQRAGRHGGHRAADRGGKINALMESAGKGPVRKNARTKRGGDAGWRNGW